MLRRVKSPRCCASIGMKARVGIVVKEPEFGAPGHEHRTFRTEHAAAPELPGRHMVSRPIAVLNVGGMHNDVFEVLSTGAADALPA